MDATMPDYALEMQQSNRIDAALTTVAEAVGGTISILGDWTAGAVRWLLSRIR
jgi:hypothetical protein